MAKKHKHAKKSKVRKPIKLTKITNYQHKLLHTLLVTESKGLLDRFISNIETLHGGLDFADVLEKQENLTIFSAFPWEQTGEPNTWKQLKNDIAVSLQYPEFRGTTNESV